MRLKLPKIVTVTCYRGQHGTLNMAAQEINPKPSDDHVSE